MLAQPCERGPTACSSWGVEPSASWRTRIGGGERELVIDRETPVRPGAGRLADLGLAGAMVVSAALLLYISRGFTFFNDELAWFALAPPDYDPGVLLRPHITHLMAVGRAIYATSLKVFGPEYLPVRAIAVIGVSLCAGLFYVLARRRVGTVALLPTIVLLFLGSSWSTVVSPIGIPYLYSIAAGLGALIAIERGDRWGEVAACLLITVSVATFSFGLVFLVGVAASVLMRGDRVRRAWVFAVPTVLYALWWVLVLLPFELRKEIADPSNIVFLPEFAFESLGAILGAITGLNLELAPGRPVRFNRPPLEEQALFPVLAIAGIALFALILYRRGRPRASFAVFLAVLLAFWVSTGLSAGPGRGPTTARYIFPGAVMLLLVAVEALRGARSSRPVLAALVGLTALSVTVNVIHMREARTFLTAYTTNARSTLAMVELAGDNGSPTFRPGTDAKEASPFVPVTPEEYLMGVSNWGSLASTLSEVRGLPPVVRARADVVLVRALGLRLARAAPALPVGSCRTVGEGGRPAIGSIQRGGAVLQAGGGNGGKVTLRRFGERFSASVGSVLRPGQRSLLLIPGDAAPDAWQLAVSRGPLRVCALAGGQTRIERYCAIKKRLEAGARPPMARRGALPRGGAQRNRVRRNRRLFAELLQVAPAGAREALEVSVGNIRGKKPPRAVVQQAKARLDEFERRACRL